MDGVIEDIAAVGVDHVDRHLAAAVVHLVAHGSVAVDLGIAQHEVITFPLDGIAPARDVFVRAHFERHPVGTQCPEAVADPGKYPGGTVGGRRQRAGPLRRTGGSGRSRGTGGGTENGTRSGTRSGTGSETRRGTGGGSSVNNGCSMEAKGSMEVRDRMEARGGISLKTGGRGVAAGKGRGRGGNRREIRGGRKSASSRHIRGNGDCGDGECRRRIASRKAATGGTGIVSWQHQNRPSSCNLASSEGMSWKRMSRGLAPCWRPTMPARSSCIMMRPARLKPTS